MKFKLADYLPTPHQQYLLVNNEKKIAFHILQIQV
jgi:hypothetical protein